MKIGIDGRYQGQPLTGVPRYIDELCRVLDELLPQASFVLYAMQADGIRMPSSRWTLRVEPRESLRRLKPNLWWKFCAHRLIRQDGLNTLWCAAGLIPLGIDRLPCVLTVYDLTFRLYPQTMSRANLWAYRLFFARDLARADKVLAISEGTSTRAAAFYGRTADAIVRPDAGAQFRPAGPQAVSAVRARYGLTKPYFLAVSTLEPRKNFNGLIEAFLFLRHSGKLPDQELVLIGKKGWRDTALVDRIAAADGASIRSLGFVPDEDLPALYSGCELFCMPSLYEGFGIPVREARRCGARVVATAIPEMKEAGDGDTTFVKAEPQAIAEGIVKALAQPRTVMHAASNDSWQAAAQTMIPFLTASGSTTSAVCEEQRGGR